MGEIFKFQAALQDRFLDKYGQRSEILLHFRVCIGAFGAVSMMQGLHLHKKYLLGRLEYAHRASAGREAAFYRFLHEMGKTGRFSLAGLH